MDMHLNTLITDNLIDFYYSFDTKDFDFYNEIQDDSFDNTFFIYGLDETMFSDELELDEVFFHYIAMSQKFILTNFYELAVVLVLINSIN